ncbi:MAG: component of SufBCD complex [Pseudomonadota bacterium]
MDFYFLQTALEVIDFRSFSNLWFWIALAVLWSTASHWVIGVPFDMVRRAQQGHDASTQDMLTLAAIQSRRIRYIAEATGVITTGFAFFVVSSLVIMGFLYDVEFAQALLSLFLPLTIVGWLSLLTARRVEGLEATALARLLANHRRMVQAVGIVSIFVTSMWGMWVNLNHSVLGG